MAASRSLAGCLALWLLLAGCETPSLRWNRFSRDVPADAPDDRAASVFREWEEEQDETPLPRRTTEEMTPAASSAGPAPAHNVETSAAPGIPTEFLERYSHTGTPETPDTVAEVPVTTRPVALAGVIDAPPATSGVEQAAGPQTPSADSSVVPSAPIDLPPTIAAAAPPADESSPWGLPRIPDVLGMSRLTEEAAATDWRWGIGQRLIPGGHSDGPAPTTPDPVRSASLPNALPGDTAVWNGSTAYSREELAKLISLLEAELAGVTPTTESERRDFLRRHVLLRNLYLLAGRPHDAQQVVPEIDPADQEFWTELNWAMASYFDEEMLPSRSDRAAQTVTRLASAQRALEPLVPLEIRNLQFCRSINGFGNYETFGVNEFTAGQQLLLYTEVRHFTSESDPSGVHRTLLESEIEIYSEGPTRELIDRTVFPSTEDLCRTRRSDYFHSYRIDLPSSLQPGTYVLELTVEDRLAGKTATDSRRFVIVP